MDFLQDFWTWVYIVGLAMFALMALIIIPLGLRDLIRLFAHLNVEHRNGVDPEEDTQPARGSDEPA